MLPTKKTSTSVETTLEPDWTKRGGETGWEIEERSEDAGEARPRSAAQPARQSSHRFEGRGVSDAGFGFSRLARTRQTGSYM